MTVESEKIVSLLEDNDADSQAVIEHLRRDADLRRVVFAWARQSSRMPPSLAMVVFEVEGADLVRAYLNAKDLETGVWLLPRIEDPYAEYREQGEQQLDALAASLSQANDPGQVAQILGNDYGFGGDRVDYHHPHNSFLPHVIEQRAGLPIAVGALWALICKRLGFHVRLLAIPGHVFGAYALGEEDYFVDLFANGAPVDRTLLDSICQMVGHPDASDFLTGATSSQLHQRMAANLVISYQHRGDLIRAQLAAAMARGLI